MFGYGSRFTYIDEDDLLAIAMVESLQQPAVYTATNPWVSVTQVATNPWVPVTQVPAAQPMRPVKKTGLPPGVQNYATWIRCNGGYCQNGKPTPRVQVSNTQTVSEMRADLRLKGWICDSKSDYDCCPDCIQYMRVQPHNHEL